MPYDSNGIFRFEEGSYGGNYSDMLNIGQDATSDAVGALKADIQGLDSQLSGVDAAGTKKVGGTFTPQFANFTLGNGTMYARWSVVDEICTVIIKITLGTTSSIALGGMNVNTSAFPLPPHTVYQPTGLTAAGTGTFYDNSGAQGYVLQCMIQGLSASPFSTQAILGTINASNQFVKSVTNTLPVAFGANDSITLVFKYMVM